MKRKILFLFLVGAASLAWAAETMLYGLEQVTSVSGLKNNGQYVLVQAGRAILHTESNSGLATSEIDVHQPVSLSDACVWTFNGESGFFQLNCYSGGSMISLRNNKTNGNYSSTSSHNLFFGAETFDPTYWQFTFSDGGAVIKNVTSTSVNKNRYLALSGDICYAESSSSGAVLVYKIAIPTNYSRTEIANNQIGTICLPFATESYSGATFYTLSCKETDGAGNPTKVYYELVTDQLEAGKPYVYVPDNDATALSFTANPGTDVTSPANYNGFVGTFAQIDPAEQNALTDNYVIQDNMFKKCGINCGLRAYRAYVKMNEVPNVDAIPAPSRRMLVIGQTSAPEYMEPNQGVWTNMTENVGKVYVQRAICNGKLVVVRDGVRYDVLGRKCYE